MADARVAEGYFVTTSTFTGEARAWVANKQLHLIDGADFVGRMNDLEEADRHEILGEVFAGDYRTPTCPKCDVKLVIRTSEKDRSSFWGCPRYPRCHYTLNSATAVDAA